MVIVVSLKLLVELTLHICNTTLASHLNSATRQTLPKQKYMVSLYKIKITIIFLSDIFAGFQEEELRNST